MDAAYRCSNRGPVSERFPFQPELYRAFGDRDLQSVAVMKSAQCGISAAAVSLTLYAGDVWGASVLYVLPTGDDAKDFSDTRVRPAIEGSGYLRGRVSSTDNKGLERIGDSFLYFRGSVSERKALSIPADVLILDEYDRLDQRNVPLLRKRLGSPNSLHLERRFSNPGYPEFGIHALCLSSDRRSWLIRCPGCSHEAPIGYEQTEDRNHFVDDERRARVPGGCHRELAKGAIAGGRWVPAHPSVDARGYHISKLIVPDQRIDDVIVEHARTDEDSVKAHHNFDLGLPYASRGGSLSEDLVLACRREWAMPTHYNGTGWVTAGVDVGKVLHVRISSWSASGHAVPLYIGEISDFEELALVWNRYGVRS
jgi:phage terminase large subunit GpA-like protein